MPFTVTSRQATVFIAGIVIGGAGAWALFGTHSGAPGRSAGPQPPVTAARTAAAAAVPVASGACAFAPVVATAAGDDGRVTLRSDLSGRGAKDVDDWLLAGKEAVAAGRQRDAETDFLMACRAAEQLGDGGGLPQAEAMYHLGRHYAALAGAAAEPRSSELWGRAEGLFAASLQAFNARYGEASDKTRFAAKGLAEVRTHTGGAPALAAAAAAAPARAQTPKQPAHAQAAVPAPPRPQEPKVASVKPAPPKPRPAAAPAQPADEPAGLEPPARAVGSAIGQARAPAADEPADAAQ
jgi:hypothetical protein